MTAPAVWQVFTSPAEKWAVQPSFVVGEYLFIAAAAFALIHALRQSGAERRRHVAVWVGALVAGTANDLIFMALPLVDNFWQAQATIMITARLPLYIPCVYVWFMYVPTVAVWRVGLPPLPRAALTGLIAIVIYAPYDIIGAKFLWWTWHDTDGPIAVRLLGAPAASSTWVITFAASFAWLINRALDRDEGASQKTVGVALAVVAAFATVLMMVQMTALQQLDGGTPGLRALATVIAIYAAVTLFGWRHRQRVARYAFDAGLRVVVLVYFCALVAIMALGKPATHRNTSVHQTVGPCYVDQTDITGQTRHEFLCLTDYDEDFTFDCVAAPPKKGQRWFTTCGRAHRDFSRWMGAIAGLGAIGLLAFTLLLRRRATRP